MKFFDEIICELFANIQLFELMKARIEFGRIRPLDAKVRLDGGNVNGVCKKNSRKEEF